MGIPLVCIVLLLLVISGGPTCVREYRLDHSGKVTSGTVTAREKKADTRFFEYEFQVSGAGYQGRKLVRHKHYDEYRKGDSVQIEYLPDDPKINRPKGIAVRRSRRYYFLGILLFIFAVIVIFNFRWQQKKLDAERQKGNLATGLKQENT
ncbi:DUF3592 domain-containing protein [Desulfococcaceae bacterium HSG8]|nr:DUF3592 domain-containing protein [Desulfococcaceae bacterium HSG8]